MPDEWYGSDESKTIAENFLLYQRDLGGWPKNIAVHKPLTETGKAQIRDEKGQNDAIFGRDSITWISGNPVSEMILVKCIYWEINFCNGIRTGFPLSAL